MKLQACAVILGLVSLLSVQGCRGIGAANATDRPASVTFRIRPWSARSSRGTDTRTWIATYEAGGRTARFGIQLSLKPPAGDSLVATSSGMLYRVPQSDSSLLIQELARVLEAKRPPRPAAKSDRLPFTMAILGQNQSRGGGKSGTGGFHSEPAGTWIATRVFVGEMEGGEFLLNLDPAAGIGEIAIKDPDDGDAVMKELSKVL